MNVKHFITDNIIFLMHLMNSSIYLKTFYFYIIIKS